MAGRILVTPPSLEPVTVADMDLYARVTTTTEDPLMTTLITAARKRCEDWRGQAFITQTWDYFQDQFPLWDGTLVDQGFTPMGVQAWATRRGTYWQTPIQLPRPPIQSVTWVKYTPYTGGTLTMDPATYQVDTSNIWAPRVLPNTDKMWPTDLLQSVNGVNVRFVAGYGNAAVNVPEQIVLAIKQLVAFWFRNRDAMNVIPDSVNELLAEVTGGFTYA